MFSLFSFSPSSSLFIIIWIIEVLDCGIIPTVSPPHVQAACKLNRAAIIWWLMKMWMCVAAHQEISLMSLWGWGMKTMQMGTCRKEDGSVWWGAFYMCICVRDWIVLYSSLWSWWVTLTEKKNEDQSDWQTCLRRVSKTSASFIPENDRKTKVSPNCLRCPFSVLMTHKKLHLESIWKLSGKGNCYKSLQTDVTIITTITSSLFKPKRCLKVHRRHLNVRQHVNRVRHIF